MLNLLKSKIHRARVTEANLHYEGSITIDRNLMEAADIYTNEMVKVLNLYNGERIETYAISGEPGSGTICLNGAAARKFLPGDLVIIMASQWIPRSEAADFEPRIIHVDEQNQVVLDK